MRRRDYIQAMGATVGVGGLPTVSAESSDVEDAGQAYVKEYDVGKVISIVVQKPVEAAGVVTTVRHSKRLKTTVLNSFTEPTMETQDEYILHYFHQLNTSYMNVHFGYEGDLDGEDIPVTRNRVQGTPSIEFLRDATHLSTVNIVYLGIKSDDVVSRDFKFDTDYETLYWETYDDEDGCWMQHPAEQVHDMWVSECTCQLSELELMRANRLRLFGVREDGVIERIPIVREQGGFH